MTNCRDAFTSIRETRDTVTIADGRQMPSQGLGMVHVRFGEDDTSIADVLYVPDL